MCLIWRATALRDSFDGPARPGAEGKPLQARAGGRNGRFVNFCDLVALIVLSLVAWAGVQALIAVAEAPVADRGEG